MTAVALSGSSAAPCALSAPQQPTDQFHKLLHELEQQHAQELQALQDTVDGLICHLRAAGPAVPARDSSGREPESALPSVGRAASEEEEEGSAGETVQLNMDSCLTRRSDVLGVAELKTLTDSTFADSGHLRAHIISDDLALIKDWKRSVVKDLDDNAGLMHWKVVSIHRLVTHPHFDTFCAFIIILNAVLLGIDTNWHAIHYMEASTPHIFEYLEWACTVWFSIELCLRVAGNGCSFFTASDRAWNWFDVLVVACAVVERIISMLRQSAAFTGFTIIRTIRVLRVTRAVRVIRLLKFFRELRMMVMSVLMSSSSLTWSFILLAADMYLFSIFLTNNVATYLQAQGGDAKHSEKVRAQFGSLWRANYTLFQAITGGLNWGEISDIFFDIHWSSGLVFIIFIFFTLFALTNIITGVFVDTALQNAQGDREELIQAHFRDRASTLHQAKRFFEEAADKGVMSLKEFEAHLKDTKARAHLASIGIEVSEARGLFKLLDIEECGYVTITEFISGCMRLKGNARTVDLATLMYENKRLHLQFKRLHKNTVHLIKVLSNILYRFEEATDVEKLVRPRTSASL